MNESDNSTGSAGVAAEPSEAALHAAMDAFYPGEDWRTALGRALDTSLRDMRAALKAAQAVDGGGGVAAEPVAWAYEYEASDGWQRALWWQDPRELPRNKERPGYLRNIRPLVFGDEHPPAAAPTPPAGGGETEAADAVAASVAASARRASEGLGLLKAAASACAARKATIAHAEPPASPAGDLNLLSAWATRGLLRVWTSAYGEGPSEHVAEISGIYLVADSELAAPDDDAAFVLGLWNAYRSGRLIEAAPAAPRKGPSASDLIQAIHENVSSVTGAGGVTWVDYTQVQEVITALLTTADRGEPDQGGANTEAGR